MGEGGEGEGEFGEVGEWGARVLGGGRVGKGEREY